MDAYYSCHYRKSDVASRCQQMANIVAPQTLLIGQQKDLEPKKIIKSGGRIKILEAKVFYLNALKATISCGPSQICIDVDSCVTASKKQGTLFDTNLTRL